MSDHIELGHNLFLFVTEGMVGGRGELFLMPSKPDRSPIVQCTSVEVPTNRKCAFVAGHRGDHRFPDRGEDVSNEIRLRRALDCALDDAERGTPDVCIMRVEGDSVEKVKIAIARELRAIAKRIDGLSVVTCIEVRNDPTKWDDAPYIALRGSEHLEKLKVMVELEDDRRPRIVHESTHEPLGQMVNQASNAYHFAEHRLDPVAERWRRDQAALDAELEQRDDDIDRSNS